MPPMGASIRRLCSRALALVSFLAVLLALLVNVRLALRHELRLRVDLGGDDNGAVPFLYSALLVGGGDGKSATGCSDARNSNASAAAAAASVVPAAAGDESAEEAVGVVVVAYAISVIKCGDFQTSTAGLVDAATILRHSIHANSASNPSSGSRYGYKMYAIVHKQAEDCAAPILRQFGFDVLVRDQPVKKKEIRGDFLRNKIWREWCCGEQEFVKLYAYTIDDHPIVVHTDVDFVMLRPMDDLFDAMLHPATSPRGADARRRIEVENRNATMPENIEAFLTRDYHQVIPGRKAGFQAGFLVTRPSNRTFHEYLDVIREGNYVGGFSRENGWGGMGYGAFVGAMAMQGLGAYYYDVVRPGTSVELNGCRYNHMGADILYRNQPSFHPKKYPELKGKCRNGRGMDCEDCLKTDVSLIKSVHYTNCRKPWSCVGSVQPPDTGKGKRNEPYLDPKTADVDHCMEVVRKWHEYRTDFEDRFHRLTGDDRILSGRTGGYKRETFMGHCHGVFNYSALQASPSSFAQVYKLYDESWSDEKAVLT